MEKKRVLTDIPLKALEQVVADFESEGGTITKKRQSNGKYTVTVSFPKDKY